MAKCKCGVKSRIISNVVQSMGDLNCHCHDVCASPICADPCMLGIMAPLIYDEIGINLCAQFAILPNIQATYPTATNATIRVIDATYSYGDTGVRIEALSGRANCYDVTLSNISVKFVLDLYDANCQHVISLYPEIMYLPTDATAETYDEDTNPSSATLRIFAPYGFAYSTATPPVPNIQFIGMNTEDSAMKQGVNMFAMAKLLDLNTQASTITVGLTLVLQSLYYVGYKVKSAGKIEIPKGSIMDPEDSDCMRFVAGDLLNLAIKPLDLGKPFHEEYDKEECENKPFCDSKCKSCIGGQYTTGECNLGAKDESTPLA